LDAADLRHIKTRTVVRTEQGEVEVEVPERDEVKPETVETPDETRQSIRVQAKVAQLGAALGFTVWVPASDRARVVEQLSPTVQDKLVTALPLNYNVPTIQTIENIDVIWLERRAIAHAFEIEHTAATTRTMVCRLKRQFIR
jgi:hypothetical protein